MTDKYKSTVYVDQQEEDAWARRAAKLGFSRAPQNEEEFGTYWAERMVAWESFVEAPCESTLEPGLLGVPDLYDLLVAPYYCGCTLRQGDGTWPESEWRTHVREQQLGPTFRPPKKWVEDAFFFDRLARWADNGWPWGCWIGADENGWARP